MISVLVRNLSVGSQRNQSKQALTKDHLLAFLNQNVQEYSCHFTELDIEFHVMLSNLFLCPCLFLFSSASLSLSLYFLLFSFPSPVFLSPSSLPFPLLFLFLWFFLSPDFQMYFLQVTKEKHTTVTPNISSFSMPKGKRVFPASSARRKLLG